MRIDPSLVHLSAISFISTVFPVPGLPLRVSKACDGLSFNSHPAHLTKLSCSKSHSGFSNSQRPSLSAVSSEMYSARLQSVWTFNHMFKADATMLTYIYLIIYRCTYDNSEPFFHATQDIENSSMRLLECSIISANASLTFSKSSSVGLANLLMLKWLRDIEHLSAKSRQPELSVTTIV